ncbi:unnamed protein product [Brachionus calyciflorus]|uniref:Tryptophan 2,3-dioxygenase n=1 Tax=Brachionus calyciflorus TaxID=104777 RepID=A0A813YKA4_9BILA|nr:unnamed protein product [Brachionus calyciflorus]
MTDEESINILNSLVPKQLDINELIKNPPKGDTEDVSSKPSGCPYLNGSAPNKPMRMNSVNKKFPEWQTSISVASEPVNYNDYLKLDKILDAQYPESTKYGHPAHDEHLFIVVHQAYELWFKQLIFEIDSIRDLLGKPIVDERCLLVVVQRLQRINLIWKLLNDQISVLETMAPTDFLDFRGYLSTASGFQSVQFRLFENKLGLAEHLRIKFNQQKYDYLFTDSETKEKIRKSVEETSMLKLIEAWLERTPGLVCFEHHENGDKVEYNYLLKEYEIGVNNYLKDTYLKAAQEETDEEDRKSLIDEYKKTLDAFGTIFDKEKHDKLIERGERKLSHKALWGALMIWLNRDEPRFHLPYQMLSLLTDLDAIMNRWRYNHALLAQRQVGNKSGTGGSSGYSYLRSTASDRYKIFNDIVNLSTWLIPKEYLPKLNEDLKKRLNTFD